MRYLLVSHQPDACLDLILWVRAINSQLSKFLLNFLLLEPAVCQMYQARVTPESNP